MPAYSKRYRRALSHAAKLHRNQFRKGGDVPYVAHLLHVSAMVWEFGGDEDQAIAALLHDAAEDIGGSSTIDVIRRRYGEHVARMVSECSDSLDPGGKAPWLERKEHHIASLREADDDTLLIVAADKVHNVESMLADLAQHGSRMWARFNAPAPLQVWYHRSIHEVLAARLGPEEPIVRRLGQGVGSLAVGADVPLPPPGPEG